MSALVLDSWAMIAWLQGEEPARSGTSSDDVGMSMINIGEVFYLLADCGRGSPQKHIPDFLRRCFRRRDGPASEGGISDR